jgi:hypothetical protein
MNEMEEGLVPKLFKSIHHPARHRSSVLFFLHTTRTIMGRHRHPHNPDKRPHSAVLKQATISSRIKKQRNPSGDLLFVFSEELQQQHTTHTKEINKASNIGGLF